MKCGEPKPGDSWRSCDKELKHAGSHRYLNESWPRPVPDGHDWDVQSLLEETLPRTAYGVNERSFPIIVTETVTRLLWVDAENEDDALAYWADDYSDIELKGTEVLDGYLEFERPDEDQRQEAFRSQANSNRGDSKVGPLQKCPDCEATAFGREWLHDPYRKCHGPIAWRLSLGRPMREWRRGPAFVKAVAA
jgi:hypothetical protein